MTYRESLILFYREDQSVASIAKTLDITEEAARQQLSRGRELLRHEVAAMIEGTMVKTRPAAAFMTSMMAAVAVLSGGGACGWVAVGRVLIGVINIGGLAAGLISCGGLAVGLVSIGGLGLGGFAIGGLAIGYQAVGGLALAWDFACGGGAWARDAAIGGAARALLVNTPELRQMMEAHWTVRAIKWQIANKSAYIFVTMAISVLPSILMTPLMYRRRHNNDQ